MKRARPEAANAAYEFPIVRIAGAPDNQAFYSHKGIVKDHNVEGNIDAELVPSIAWPIPMTVQSTGGKPPYIPDLLTTTDTNEPYLTSLTYELAQDNLPDVLSTSYGDDEQTVPESYAKRVCSGYAQLGARGISVLFSSGK